MDLRAVSAVVEDDDQYLQSGTNERFQLLNMHQEPAVPFEQHDGLIRTVGSASDRIGQSVPNGAELTNGQEIACLAAVEVRREIRLVTCNADHRPVLGQYGVQSRCNEPWVESIQRFSIVGRIG